MAEKCPRCRGLIVENLVLPPGQYWSSPVCYCAQAQREALDSAAAALKEQGNNELDPKWRAALFGAAVTVETHDPTPRPRPRVSRKAVEDSLDEAVCCLRGDFVKAILRVLDRAGVLEE